MLSEQFKFSCVNEDLTKYFFTNYIVNSVFNNIQWLMLLLLVLYVDFRNFISVWRVYVAIILLSTYALYKNVEFPLKFIQSVMLLEILHNMIGLIKTPMFTCVMQYTSHFILVWGVFSISKEIERCGGFKLMLLSWSSIESVRYLYYLLNLFNSKIPKFFLYLRYNLSLFTIPVGVIGEMWCMLKSVKIVKETKV